MAMAKAMATAATTITSDEEKEVEGLKQVEVALIAKNN